MPVQPITHDALESLSKELQNFLEFSDGFLSSLRAVMFEISYKKGARILNFLQTQQMVWFMISGIAREIMVDPASYDERTSWFWMEKDFIFANPGFFNREPSQRTIEVLENCRMAFIHYEDWKMLHDKFAETDLLTEKIRGYYAGAKLLHADQLLSLPADERYLKNRKLIMSLFSRTKRKYIAEFMGMAPDTLSRLFKKYRRL